MFDRKKGIKVKNIYIEHYKVLKNFKIDFCNKNNELLPIIILAGINGSGKTAILDSIAGIKKINGLKLKVMIDGKEKIFDSNSSGLSIGGNGIREFWYNDEIKDKILYFSYNIDLRHIKEFLPEYIQKLVFEYDIKASEVYAKIRENINNIFKDMELNIEFDSRDAKGNIFFRHKNTKEKILIDNLSSGERTLVSEILFLYLNNIKNMIILIDEPELSLHPAWQNRVLKLYENFAKENNCQIIIATHSPHIIGSAKSEYLRILLEKDGKIEVVDDFSGTYGAKFHQVLTDVMGVEDLRTPEVSEKFKIIEKMIANNQFDTQEFENKWQELEQELGKNYFDLKLLKLEIASRRKNVQNN
jgi:predicted ATP-binding protein involved in virulence